VEEELTAPTTSETVSPLEAKKGDYLDGGFRVIERIGSGSSSIALLVETQAGMPERVLKVSHDEAHDARIRAEGKILEGLRQHTNIVRLYEMPEVGGRAALLLERAGERTLARRLRDDGRPSLDLLSRWGEELLSAVRFLEEEGVSHRDVKPDNIGIGSVGQRGSLRLILFDFSLSNTPAESIYAGTRPYLDPFLVQRAPRRWDLYAERYAGAMTLYEMATGTLPVWGDGVSDPSLLQCEVSIDRGLFDPHVRELMSAFFAKGLRRNPRERFDNAEEMLRAWRHVFEALTAHKPASEAGDPLERAARSLTPKSTIVEVGYSPASLSVLEGMGIQTIRDLLAVERVRSRYLSSVADRTRKEIRLTAKRLAQLRPDLAPDGEVSATSEGPADRRDVDYLVERLRPKETEEERRWRAVEVYLGLGNDACGAIKGWPSVGEAAQLAQAWSAGTDRDPCHGTRALARAEAPSGHPRASFKLDLGPRRRHGSAGTRCGTPGAMTVRGGGVPIAPLGFHAGKKNGSAASELRRRCA
jgi:serine/threonine protein kinase